MATITWPTTRAFMGATFSLGLDVSESTYTGFLTNNRQRRSNSADRLRAVLTLPPRRSKAEAGQIEALLMALRSAGDYLSMGMPHRPVPLGAFGGSPTLSASAAAGARSIAVASATATPNLLRSGRTLGASAWQPVRVTIASNTQTAPDGTTTADEVVDSDTGDNAHFLDQSVPGLADNSIVTVSAYIRAKVNGFCRLAFVNKAGTQVGTAFNAVTGALGDALGSPISRSTTSVGSGWHRVVVTVNVGSGASEPEVRFALLESLTDISFVATGNMGMYLWGVQCEVGSTASTYVGSPTLAAGDWLAVGGNFMQVAYPGATLDDSGAGTVPLALPLVKAVTNGAAVTWDRPTGLWELDDDGLQLDYSAGNIMNGIAIPLRQVVA